MNGYSITYHLDGGDNGTNPATYTPDILPITLAPATRTGYTFGGWYDAASGGNPVTGIPLGSTGNKEFYARWTAITYTVVYNKNAASGVTGTMPPSTHTYGQEQPLTTNGYSKAGLAFAGWNTLANGSGTAYADGERVKNLAAAQGAAITLYAQWWPLVPVNISIWANEDGNILTSNTAVTISQTGAGYPDRFTATVASPYSGVRWYLNGFPKGNTGQSITVYAADYNTGTYTLGVSVTRDGAPYSTDIRFTVVN
jgi:uncharacterized repeat protein (TIGR02543 family)